MQDTYTLNDLLDVVADYSMTAYHIERDWKSAGVERKTVLDELVEEQADNTRGMVTLLAVLTGEDPAEVIAMVSRRAAIKVLNDSYGCSMKTFYDKWEIVDTLVEMAKRSFNDYLIAKECPETHSMHQKLEECSKVSAEVLSDAIIFVSVLFGVTTDEVTEQVQKAVEEGADHES